MTITVHASSYAGLLQANGCFQTALLPIFCYLDGFKHMILVTTLQIWPIPSDFAWWFSLWLWGKSVLAGSSLQLSAMFHDDPTSLDLVLMLHPCLSFLDVNAVNLWMCSCCLASMLDELNAASWSQRITEAN